MHCLGTVICAILPVVRRSATFVLAAALLAVPAGCGDGGSSPAPSTPKGDAALRGDPQLAKQPKGTGEIILRADASPKTHGPIALDGRYRVRFAQYAPEDPQLDFTQQTDFVADLETPGGRTAAHLFKAAIAFGSTTIDVHGRFLVDVSFGDFPYVLRFTPLAK
jgi:hypothetical protein